MTPNHPNYCDSPPRKHPPLKTTECRKMPKNVVNCCKASAWLSPFRQSQSLAISALMPTILQKEGVWAQKSQPEIAKRQRQSKHMQTKGAPVRTRETLSGQRRDFPPYRAISFRDSYRRGGYRTLFALFLCGIAQASPRYPFFGWVSHLHFACSPKVKHSEKGEVVSAMLRLQNPPSPKSTEKTPGLINHVLTVLVSGRGCW